MERTSFRSSFRGTVSATCCTLNHPSESVSLYSDFEGDLDTSDAKTAAGNFEFLRRWYELFPEYRRNELYITGESYAGHYVPTLADEILRRDTSGEIKITGLAVGSPATNSDWFLREADPLADAWPYLTYMYHHGIVSETSYHRALKECKWEQYLDQCGANFTGKSQECIDAEAICIEEIPYDVDIYNIDAEVCLEKNVDRLRYTSLWSPLSRIVAKKRAAARFNFEPGYPVDPCIENYVVLYLNRKEVQEAIHVHPTQWDTFGKIRYLTMCDDMSKLWPQFFRNPRSQHWRIVIFSGDFDACVPFQGTQHWIKCLNRPVVSGWHPWRVNNQVAGNVIVYDRITFVTIKGSGHMVPYVTPVKGFNFFQRMIDKQPW